MKCGRRSRREDNTNKLLSEHQCLLEALMSDMVDDMVDDMVEVPHIIEKRTKREISP
jgi:hypothetical protein